MANKIEEWIKKRVMSNQRLPDLSNTIHPTTYPGIDAAFKDVYSNVHRPSSYAFKSQPSLISGESKIPGSLKADLIQMRPRVKPILYVPYYTPPEGLRDNPLMSLVSICAAMLHKMDFSIRCVDETIIVMYLSLFYTLGHKEDDLRQIGNACGYVIQPEFYVSYEGYLMGLKTRLRLPREPYHYDQASIMFHQVSEHNSAAIFPLFTFLIPIVKQFTPENMIPYMFTRYKSLCQLIGLEIQPNITAEEMIPGMKVDVGRCNTLNNYLSGKFLLRRKLFILIMSLKDSSEGYTKLCGELIFKLASGTDMSYIENILKYCVNMLPEIFSLRLLNDGSNVIVKIIQFLDQFEPDARPYIKLLWPPDACACLNRNHLINWIYLAAVIGEKVTPSMANYKKPTVGPSIIQLGTVISKYIDHLIEKGHVQLYNSEVSGLDIKSRTTLLNNYMNDLNIFANAPDDEIARALDAET